MYHVFREAVVGNWSITHHVPLTKHCLLILVECAHTAMALYTCLLFLDLLSIFYVGQSAEGGFVVMNARALQLAWRVAKLHHHCYQCMYNARYSADDSLLYTYLLCSEAIYSLFP